MQEVKLEKITVDELLKKVGSKYGLISLVVKRAREMLNDSEKTIKAGEIINKIFEEIVQDKITIKQEEVDESKQKESEEDKEDVRRVSRREKD
ncbi:DNA-directed RNA polymerase subunit omega [Candidatus Desantisbacteria bacterium CG07_land_8_20_14_0_80_39_15]|uniref:DNA-directed RNA polymerase subunit omega n=2 Tax=unclassified Candidatus Desantisiibacteriota TaxID=3106372 RepID=A0A2H9P9V9_9BACT|nr:MAG: DNA-directed RNA polymerase subunit omega [Candidatus Desantisbacteria bacterium CG07_land_8_20_14_0_80_39_15]PIZ15066.1 MAG: DNA-directed RNA polymerase subunit omega [Candidatus Desantisbacteria bacterium CG_4_10_14_0_8_um_filter_39_17]